MTYLDPDGREGLAFIDSLEVAYNTFTGSLDDTGYVVAYPMLKMGSGILNNDAGEFVGGVALIGVDAVGGIVLKEAAYALRLGWTSRANLLAHFETHGAEMGFKVAEQYANAAQKFARTSGQEAVQTVVSGGETYIYNSRTKEFALLNKEGRIVTYLKANLRWWNRKLKRLAEAASSAGGAVQ